MDFPLAVKSANYLGVGVCWLDSFLHSHTIFLVDFGDLIFFFSSTGIFWVLGLGEAAKPLTVSIFIRFLTINSSILFS